MHRSSNKIVRAMLHFFPLLALLLLFDCGDSRLPSGLLNPGGDDTQPGGGGSTDQSEAALDITLTVRQGTPENQPALAVANDDTSSDSLHLFIDVAVENAGPDVLHVPVDVITLNMRTRITFVDLPYKKHFRSGKIKLVIGWTHGGLQASDTHEVEFSTDSALVVNIPLSRVDSLKVSDNVAVYGEVLSPGRFIRANRVQAFDSTAAPRTPKPDLVGDVRLIDTRANRLQVANTTVVLGDTTHVVNAEGQLIGIDQLAVGANEFTITALAWAFTTGIGTTANGWEFKRFNINVARPFTP
ncbi:MAG: hypothetical protein A3F83_13505 [Candidatus Glassbacteria bacterium RIFCSPLOWO2_12_FULL_58_11]|uniref:DUF4382 domain-containing protein n=1 Tax=Candidatus Glassbacteria bacterium RIFCSPLOWO2_12_FULL_58_11 TaxID=1817867 RepID=A0A1F5Z1V7_9BACT|nr:MAG: hypothetical protein A3F83_13505 [Candidatus Glassbacteria bacterium RIFCSPLOWO2_12_FULL_58_11]